MQIIEMPSIAHVSFYFAMLQNVDEINERTVLIDKICLMSPSETTKQSVLKLKWDLLAAKNKWFDCL